MSKREKSFSSRTLANTAACLVKVRLARQLELAEDYVEMIEDLIMKRGEARSADFAECFGVSPATVVRSVQRLIRDGLVRSEPYRFIFQTPKGRTVAAKAGSRHALVLDLLDAIGVSVEAVEVDAEGIEHQFGEETLAAIPRHLGR